MTYRVPGVPVECQQTMNEGSQFTKLCTSTKSLRVLYHFAPQTTTDKVQLKLLDIIIIAVQLLGWRVETIMLVNNPRVTAAAGMPCGLSKSGNNYDHRSKSDH